MNDDKQQPKCKHADVCFAPCSMKEPRPEWYIVAWPCYEPEPPALDLDTIAGSVSQLPPGAWPRHHIEWLIGELERAEERVAQLNRGFHIVTEERDDARADLRRARCKLADASVEIGEVRVERDELLQTLETCRAERAALSCDLSASRRLTKSYIGLWRRTSAKLDTLAREAQADTVMVDGAEVAE